MAGNIRRASADQSSRGWTADRTRSRLLTRSLRVELLEDRVTPSVFTELEPNGSTAAANVVTVPVGDILTTAPANWLTIRGAIGSTGDLDFFRFTLTSKSGVFFDVDSRDTGLSTTLDSFLQVFDAGGAAVANGSNNDGYDFDGFIQPTVATFDASTPDSSLYLDLPAGTYFVRISALNDASTGQYDLRLLADANYSKTVPAFSSLPGSADTLYIDFDGHSATDDWGTYTALPYGLDSDGSTFSPGERLGIWNHWRVTAEDFSPFNINVTTVNPGSFDNGVAFRTVVTNSDGSIIGQPGAGLLGVALLNSYVNSYVNTAFTFADAHGDYGVGSSGRIVAAAYEMGSTTSHEFGHALGMEHLLTINGSPTTAPIMLAFDAGLIREVWGVGPTGGGFQDDMAIISSLTNTFGYRPDDHGNTIATATSLSASGGVATASGVIAQPTDVDYFRFNSAGNTSIAVDVDPFSSNLDMQVRLYDANGLLIATSAPTNSLSATLAQSLAAGVYYLEVRSNGGNGEAGQYAVQITNPDATPPITAIAYPQTGNSYGVGNWSGSLTGTATDPSGPGVLSTGVQRVEVSIRQASTGLYWNGSSFASGAEVFLTAEGADSWSLPFHLLDFPFNDAYVIHARAVDFGGNVDSRRTSVTITVAAPDDPSNNPPAPSPVSPTPPVQPPPGAGQPGGLVRPTSEHRPIYALGTDVGGGPRVRVVDAVTKAVRFDGFVYDPNFRGGVRVATGDVTGDGVPDVAVGAGVGGGPHVQVLDGRTFEVVASFFAYESSFTGGVFVAVGDVNGDGRAEIITGPGAGGGPLVKIFDSAGRQLGSFFAYDPNFRGGVRVAAADVSGDGLADIITGAGVGGGPLVRVFDGATLEVLTEYFAADPAVRGGLFVAGGDMDGDGVAEVVAGADGAGAATVAIRRSRDGSLVRINVSDVGRPDQPGAIPAVPVGALSGTGGLGTDDTGLRVALANLDANGKRQKLLVSRGPGYPSRVHSYRLDPLSAVDNFLAFEEGFTSGVFVG